MFSVSPVFVDFEFLSETNGAEVSFFSDESADESGSSQNKEVIIYRVFRLKNIQNFFRGI